MAAAPGASLGLVKKSAVLPHHQRTAHALAKEEAFQLKRQRTREAAQRMAAKMKVIHAREEATRKVERRDERVEFLGDRLARDAVERALRINQAMEEQQLILDALVRIQSCVRGMIVRCAVRRYRAARAAMIARPLAEAKRRGVFVWHVGWNDQEKPSSSSSSPSPFVSHAPLPLPPPLKRRVRHGDFDVRIGTDGSTFRVAITNLRPPEEAPTATALEEE